MTEITCGAGLYVPASGNCGRCGANSEQKCRIEYADATPEQLAAVSDLPSGVDQRTRLRTGGTFYGAGSRFAYLWERFRGLPEPESKRGGVRLWGSYQSELKEEAYTNLSTKGD